MTTTVPDPTACTRYQYRPLRFANSVRILQLTPSIIEDDPIQCTLTEHPLSDPTLRFEPLSYTWGDDADVVQIYVGDDRAPLPVTRNCSDTLRSLRLPDKGRPLWIDAVCIDQANVAERSAQVRIMDQLYARGFRTVIYLGEATPGSEMLFGEPEEADLDLEGIRSRPALSPALVPQVEALIARPWFRRVWVLQEVFVNESRLVMCGRRRASWRALESALHGFRVSRVTEASIPAAFISRSWWFDSGCVWLNLLSMLDLTRANLASEPRDRIFALKALLGRRQNELNPLIDYGRGLVDILMEAATRILESVGVVLLSAIRSPHNRAMPSWIPDWTQVDHPVFTRNLNIDIDEEELETAPLGSHKRKYG